MAAARNISIGKPFLSRTKGCWMAEATQNPFRRRLARTIFGPKAQRAVSRMIYAARYVERLDANSRRTKNRYALYDLVSEEIIRHVPFDYLEFGVYRGDSIRYIAAQNPVPGARFWGFDSFEGLPVDWNENNLKGAFNVGGEMPLITDDRVSFVKGWFETSLPRFLGIYRPNAKLWIHIDADLYGSALQVLTLLNPHIAAGTVVVFDEIEDLMNEFKALCDFEDMSAKRLKLLAATQDGRQAAFVCA